MKKIILQAACLISLVACTVAPRPGALNAYLNVSSIDHIYETFIPGLIQSQFNNQTFDLNITDNSSYLYKFTLNTLHVDNISGFTDKKVEYIAGTDKIKLSLGGINVTTHIDADFEALHFIPFRANEVSLRNLTAELVIEVKTNDTVHFQIVENTKITLEGVDIEMNNSVLNKLVHFASSTINKAIIGQLPKIGVMIDEQVQKINKMVSNEGAYTFVFPMMGKNLPLNLTMTHSPLTEKNSDLIELYFDGIFDASQNGEPMDITDYPPRIENSQSEQIWIHEDTIDSAIMAADTQIFPIKIDDPGLAGQLGSVFYEFKKHYGQDVKLSLNINIDEQSSKPIRFNTKQGFLIGGEGNEMKIAVDIMCSSSTHQEEKAVTLKMDFVATANITVRDLMLYPSISYIAINNVEKFNDIVPMYYHDYTQIFSLLAQNSVKDINLKYNDGLDLTSYLPKEANYFKNIIVSPFVNDQWIYAGFDVVQDLEKMIIVE